VPDLVRRHGLQVGGRRLPAHVHRSAASKWTRPLFEAVGWASTPCRPLVAHVDAHTDVGLDELHGSTATHPLLSLPPARVILTTATNVALSSGGWWPHRGTTAQVEAQHQTSEVLECTNHALDRVDKRSCHAGRSSFLVHVQRLLCSRV
jgi:hypothetical protein